MASLGPQKLTEYIGACAAYLPSYFYKPFSVSDRWKWLLTSHHPGLHSAKCTWFYKPNTKIRQQKWFINTRGIFKTSSLFKGWICKYFRYLSAGLIAKPSLNFMRLRHRCLDAFHVHFCDVIMGAVGSQITIIMIVYSIVYQDADQRKQQSSASVAFMQGIHRRPVNSPHKWPATRKMFPFDDVIISMQ